MYHDWGFVWKLNDVEEVCTMVSGAGSKTFRGEKPADLKFIRTFFEGGFFSITGLQSEIRVASTHRRS